MTIGAKTRLCKGLEIINVYGTSSVNNLEVRVLDVELQNFA